MYNRYIRNDSGVYARVQQQEPMMPSPATFEPKAAEMPPPAPQPAHKQAAPRPPEIKIVSKVLDMLHLSDIDGGDLLLLLLLFILFHENGDEELLIAIGLLLIL
ncbi:MAG: hypothetical protein IKV68_05365 [Oscillospiraceae bacterium]|nr:hypothetical protein [Oscillospiraceae bacterium]